MKVRKLLSFVLVLAMVLSTGVVTAFADSTVEIKAAEVSATLNAGDTVDVAVTTTANSGYTAGLVGVTWDNDSFVYDGIAHSVYATVSGTVKDDVVTVTEYLGSVDCINVPNDSMEIKLKCYLSKAETVHSPTIFAVKIA